MKKLWIISLVIGVAVLGSGMALHAMSCCGGEANAASLDAKAAVKYPNVVDVGNKICPVLGNPIEQATKVTYVYKGKSYNFCCAMCIGEFKKDPEKYIAKIKNEGL